MPKPSRGGKRGANTQMTQLNRQYQQTQGQRQNGAPNAYFGQSSDLQGVYAPGFDDNGNPNVQKWQGQDDETKAMRYLSRIHNNTNYDDYPDSYEFYEGDYQKFSLSLGMNDKPQVVSDAQFDQMVKQNNLQVLYRGEAGQTQTDRFMTSDYSHTGVGSYGDGFYFSDQEHVANNYAWTKGGSNGRIERMALAPTARIITYSALMKEYNKLSPQMQRILYKQGHSANSPYKNDGEAQLALKLGYNVVTMGDGYHYALTRNAFIVSDKVLKAHP